MPYRSAPQAEATKAPSDQGIVDDIIEQFADRFACYRELVQNSLDAGTKEIHVELSYEADDELMRVSVRDHGAGMSREVLENRLLVLFRSTKEDDDTKIGKFGVGFVSVMAMKPEVVKVISSFEGRRHALHLYPDLNYELFELGRSAKSGTQVELEIPLAETEVDDFNTQSWSALSTWCEHARADIYFKATDQNGQPLIHERIDRPLSVSRALLELKATSPDGQTQVVLAVVSEDEFVAYYNAGLLLHRFEGTSQWTGGKNLALKIQDTRLGHTISRDSVIRDEHFTRAVAFARSIQSERLAPAVLRRQRELAGENDYQYFALFRRVLLADDIVSEAALRIPVVDELDGQMTVGLKQWRKGGNWSSNQSTPATKLLAEHGIPVVNTSLLSPGLLTAAGQKRHSISQWMTLVTPLDQASSLARRLTWLLDEVYRTPSEIVVATVDGRGADRLILGGGPKDASYCAQDGSCWLLDDKQLERSPLALLRRPTMVLNAHHGAVAHAMKLAEETPVAAAALLCRLILLEREALSERRSARLLRHTLEDELEALL